MLVSPSESPTFRSMGTTSWRTEEYGVDALWTARRAVCGVQRKALSDLCASVEDGRLAKELLQCALLDRAWLIVETGERGGADPRVMPNDTIAALGKWGRPWTGKQYRGLLYSVGARGVGVMQVKDEAETIERVLELEAWSRKPTHHSGMARGQVPKSVFGERGSREYGVWLLSSLPGVGVETAGRIWDHFGGLPVVLRDGVGAKELMGVPGVGRVTAERIMGVFDGSEGKG